MMNLTFIASLLVTYLIGSVSSAILVCRAFRLPDPRTGGSKNPGATNVLRLGGKVPAILTLLGDALKGFLPVLLLSYVDAVQPFLGYIALSAFMGHLFPIFFEFKGGKGVATFFGAIWALDWLLGLGFCAAWMLVAVLTRYSSLAALIASLFLPVLAWQMRMVHAIFPLSVMVLFIFVRHHANIQKLLQGKESKIGKKASD